MGKLVVVVGGQYGSEGKGHVCGWLAAQEQNICVVRVAGPNAGHSAVDEAGRKWALRQVPAAAVTNLAARLVIGAGSEIEPKVLLDEVGMLDEAGFGVRERLWVDATATVLTEDNKRAEGGNDGPLQSRLGSTGKGVGAARSDRVWRRAPLWKDINSRRGMGAHNTEWLMRGWLADGACVIVEGTQGYALGQHAGHYPYCTSSDCRAIDFLGMAGLSPWAPEVAELEVWVVLRTFPIRVAGNSGPLPMETSWVELETESGGHIKPEKTTVTKKVRRVGRWDPGLARQAVMANGDGGVVKVALTFADYWWPELAGRIDVGCLSEGHIRRLEWIQSEIGAEICYLGTGPGTGIDLRGVGLWRD